MRCFIVLLLIAAPITSDAVTRYVAPGGTDAGDCTDSADPCATLAYAVAQSLDGDVISVSAGTYAAGVVLDRDVAVEGAGQASTTVTGQVAIDPEVTAAFRDISVSGARVTNRGDVVLERVTVAGNTGTGVDNRGTMAVTSATIRNNINTSSFSTLPIGGGIYNEGTLTVTETLIEGNRATNPDDYGSGGGIFNMGTVTVLRSTLRDNTADAGGGIYNGSPLVGAVRSRMPEATVIATTLSGNQGNFACGAIDNAEGAVTLFNSTVSGNGGGLCNGFGNAMLIENTTITGNATVGQLGNGALTNQGTIRLRNTVVYGNQDDCTRADFGDQPLTSFDYNLVGDLGRCRVVGETEHSLLGVDPLLGPLIDNGGPTQTHDLLPGSPAVDAGACTDLDGAPVTEDQRGEPRPRGAACDIGSVERGGVLLSVVLDGTPVVLPPEGGSLAFDATLTNATDTPQTVEVWAVLANASAGFERERPPLTLTLAPGEVRTRTFSVAIPGRAPGGAYTLTAAVGGYPDLVLSFDAFSFEKQASAFAVTATLLSPPDGMLPSSGGLVDYEVEVANVTEEVRSGELWGVLNRPNGVVVSPYAGPEAFTLAPGEVFHYAAMDSLEAEDPAGPYTFAFFAGSYPDAGAAADSFSVTKAGVRYVAPGGTDAGNTCTDAADPCGTIRFVLSLSSDGDVVDLAAGTYTEGDLRIDSDVLIRGAGADASVVQAAVTQGAATDRVFWVRSSATAAFEDLTIRHGNPDDSGGGILNDGEVTVTRCVITGNAATTGGGLENEGHATLIETTVSGNAAEWGAGIDTSERLVLLASTVSGNEAANDAGGIRNTAEVEITNSTLSGNTAGSEGGGLYHWNLLSSPIARISHSTITGNAAGEGGGIYIDAGFLNDLVVMRGSILAGNTASVGPDCYTIPFAELTSSGYNIVERTDACTIVGSTTQVDPLLGPLADNGGPTRTHAPLAGSPTINAGTCTDLDGAPVTEDQRGEPRPRGAACDIGSVESGAVSLASEMGVPTTYTLLPARPNPLQRQSSLRYGLPEPARVRLTVYDVLGRQVAILVDGAREAGWHTVSLDASGLAAGTYLYRLTASDFQATRRVTVVR